MNQLPSTTDVLVVGAGIVGLATAYQLTKRQPALHVTVIEKEPTVAFHQTGRNSGVLHSGIYYTPGSMKAITCRRGKQALEEFCQLHSVAWERCGKTIVAVDDSELAALVRIQQRGEANGVECRRIDSYELKQIEPHASGIAALFVPETGIVDYIGVSRKLASEIESGNGTVLLGSRLRRVTSHNDRIIAQFDNEKIEARYFVNCAGLYCDRVMVDCGLTPPIRIVPFRGEYFTLEKSVWSLCRNLIYPVPDPNFPFLGVHFTRMIHGGVECGPNAVLALAREGYDWRTVRIDELMATLCYPGFLKLAARYWRMGAHEIGRSLSKATFVKALQRLIPEIRSEHLTKAPSGVRAQAVSRDGKIVDDFIVHREGHMLHVLNAPSPAATASLEIGNQIVDRLMQIVDEG
ncbi:MAG: L-2-hydroxyglutarate oxidase [Pirellulaceae bacterium]|nr:L-2-hydroxyglutarate oxidase [Pirellulaceae bacterium]